MVVVMVMVVMRSRGERWSGEHQDQEHSSKNLLHEENLAWRGLRKPAWRALESKKERFVPECGPRRRGVN
jgi:hypothetical protein